MKINYLNIIIIICLLTLISGCGEEKEDENIVESIDGGAEEEADAAAVEDSEESDSITEENDVLVIEYDEETGTNAALVEELMRNLVDEDKVDYVPQDEDEEEAVMSDDNEIVIENFRGNPMDIVIEKGSTVKWTNLMYFKHIIIVLPDEGDGTFANRWINEDLKEIFFNESYEFTFEETGKYQWGSKTKFEVTKGIVTVVD